MSTRGRTLAVALVGVLGLGCGDGDGDGGSAPSTSTTAPTPAPSPTSTGSPSPAPPSAPEETAGSLRGDAANGEKLYATTCASCHGATGKGDGPIGKALQPPPADHTDSKAMATRSDEELYRVIDKGGAAEGLNPLMAAWGGVLSDQDIRDLVAYIRQLSGT